MRWLVYILLAYLVLGVQIGAGPFLWVGGAQPNLILLVVIFISLNAPPPPALMGSLLLGLMQDLTTQQPLGLFALAYGLVALMLVRVQENINRDHALTHFAATLAGGILTATVLAFHIWLRPGVGRGFDGAALPPIRQAIGPLFGSAVFTALLAPLVLGGLTRIKKIFHFQTGRRARI
jgi:rod shape-determining protein MreD